MRPVSIHEGSGNVYRDLGFPDADGMLVKAQLVSKIHEIIRDRGLTQVGRPPFSACRNRSSPASFADSSAGSRSAS